MWSIKSIKEWVAESVTFQELYVSKNRWIQLLKRNDRREIANNLFVLIDNSYGVLGGHKSIKNEDDIFNKALTYWEAIDLDGDPEADAVVIGRKTKFGLKVIGMGHDGTQHSRSELIDKMVVVLNKPGYYMSVSGEMEDMLYSVSVPYVEDERDVQRLVKDVTMSNDRGRYSIEDGDTETIFGRPLLRQ